MKRLLGDRGALAVLLSGLIALHLLAAGCSEGEKGGEEKTVSGEDVRREFDEAGEAPKAYLVQKKTDLQADTDEKMKELEEMTADLQRKLEETGRKGREKADESIALLRREQEEVRERYREFKESGGSVREEAARKLEAALTSLEEAYRKARESLEDQSEGSEEEK